VAVLGRGTSPAGKEVLLRNLFEKKLVLAKYLRELDNYVGFFHDAASGEKMQVEQESISLKAVNLESGASRCEADPKALEQDMLCPINLTIMEHPVKCFDGTTYTLMSALPSKNTLPWHRKIVKLQNRP